MLPERSTTGVFFFILCQIMIKTTWALSLQQLPLLKDDSTCSKSKTCRIGCCGPIDSTGIGYCGFGPDYCGSRCTSTCDRKSECDAGWGKEWANFSTCPLNEPRKTFAATNVSYRPSVVGTARGQRPLDTTNPGTLSEDFADVEPKDILLGIYSHLNFAFALIDPKTFRITPMTEATAKRYRELTQLKVKQAGLEVYIAIGGWDFNDPGPTRTTFSDLAGSLTAQDTFFDSLVSFMLHNDFDGVDLDWEYPVADDRGGRPADLANYVTLVKRLRERLDQLPKRHGLTLTLPASYWYLQGFDIVGLEPYVDWFNIMTYDIHGLWDAHGKEIGPHAYAHTNLTEINMGLELLWRNNINPSRVVMGLGFYGRSFTMVDPNCLKPGCRFKAHEAPAGECTNIPGVISATEIHKIVQKGGATVTFYEDAAVKVVTWNQNHWVSWDDADTLKLKIDFANRRCLGGTMIWAVDLDDGTLVEALGKAMDKKKGWIGDGKYKPMPCFGRSWPKGSNKTWIGRGKKA
ncbi:glycoside hydrolase [Aspergillus bertholletiae]|uniref:chitinase n=1 Tax=Aspergillus bertholletiae TaxID=1226010 RepID=A0A5N7AZ20_9EURO|nr:glycoside hydrolase [Aspergillus bertholletiae]